VELNPSDACLCCGILQLKKKPEYSPHYTIVVNRLRAESCGRESKIFLKFAFRILMSVEYL
jgi:hypothetical protein